MSTQRASLVFLGWDDVRDLLIAEGASTAVRLPKFSLPHPVDAGGSRTTDLPGKQLADYKWPAVEGFSLRVRDMGRTYVAFLKPSPQSLNIRSHPGDAESSGIVAGAALGAALGAGLGQSKASLFAGACIGALFGLALSDSQTKPSDAVVNKTVPARKRRPTRQKK